MSCDIETWMWFNLCVLNWDFLAASTYHAGLSRLDLALIQVELLRSSPDGMLHMQAKAHRLMGMLAVSDRQVDKDDKDKERYAEQKVLMTLIDCASAEAAKELSDKAPAPGKP